MDDGYMDRLDETILVFAFRYAIGRSTGAGLQVLNKIKRVVDEITLKSRQDMLKDIEYNRIQTIGFDHHVWNECKLLLKKSLNKPS